MKMNKKRTFTTFLGIVFMVLLMTCVFIGKDTAIDYMEQVAAQKDGKWHVALYDITKKEQEEIEKLEEVEKTAASVNYGFTKLAQSANEERPYLQVKAYQKECFDWMNIKLKSGRLPENADEIVISDAILADGGDMKIGDTIKAEYFSRSITGIHKNKKESTVFPLYNIELKYGQTLEVPLNFRYYPENADFKENKNYSGKKQELTIVGIIEIPSYEVKDAAGYTAISMLEDKEISGLKKYNLSVKLDLRKITSTYESKIKKIAGENDIEFNDYILTFTAKSSDTIMNTMVTFLTIFFVLLIMFASVFLIYNVFNMSFAERNRYLGILSSIGATGKQKRSSIYYESFCLLLFALPIGIFSGLGIVKLGMILIQPFLGKMMLLEEYIKDVDVTLIISWEAIAVIVVMSIVTVFVSAYLPARKIGKIGSIECIRGNTNKKNKQYKINTFMAKYLDVESILARNTLQRQSKKTRTITAASVTFIVIMVVTAFGGSAIQNVAEDKLRGAEVISVNFEKWDYAFSANDIEKYEILKSEIKKAEGVVQTAEWHFEDNGLVPNDCYSRKYWNALYDLYNLYYHNKLTEEEFEKMKLEDSENQIHVCGVDKETLKNIARATGTDLEVLRNTKKPAAVVVQEGELSTKRKGIIGMKPERHQVYHVKPMSDKKIGESLPIEFYSEKLDKTIQFPVQVAGYATNKQLKEFASFHADLWLIVNEDTIKQMRKITNDFHDTSSVLYIKTAEEKPEIINKLEKLSNKQECSLGKLDLSVTFQKAISGIIRVLLSCFVLLTSVICILNLFNSIRSRVSGRVKEFAIMKSVGMTKKQIRKMLLYENIGIVLKSILYAAFIVLPLMYMIQYGVTEIFGSILWNFPWILILTSILITILVIILFTEYCYRSEKQENIMERIRNENV